MRAQWLPRDAIRELRRRKLRRLVRSAYEGVPYYRELMDGAGVSVDSIGDVEDLDRIPITTKADLQRQPAERIVHRDFDLSRLAVERSSGSTGRPFDVLYDARFRSVRDSLFIRALSTAGYRLGSKLLLVTSPRVTHRSRRWLRWRYASIIDPPERLAQDLESFRPDIVYGCVTPLGLLAEEFASRSARPPRLRGIVTTAERLDGSVRRLLETTFDCEVFEFYGMTEMGVVGWECPAHRGYHLAEDTSFVQEVATGDGEGLSRLIMTNLELTAMPFIRFDSGDLGALDPNSTCSCGRSLTILERIEGRAVDCVRLGDGRVLSPYRLTLEIEKLEGIRRYQIVQHDHETFTVRVESRSDAEVASDAEIREVLLRLLGGEVSVKIERADRVRPAPGAKFRVVESALTR